MILKELEKTIHARQFEASSSSWTAKLLAQGPEKCAEKFGEEAIELIIAIVFVICLYLLLQNIPLDNKQTSFLTRISSRK